MNPLIGIAISLFPEIAKFLIGDKAGAIAGAVKKVVTEVTRTENPQEARNAFRLIQEPQPSCSSSWRKSPRTRKRSDSRRSSTW